MSTNNSKIKPKYPPIFRLEGPQQKVKVRKCDDYPDLKHVFVFETYKVKGRRSYFYIYKCIEMGTGWASDPYYFTEDMLEKIK